MRVHKQSSWVIKQGSWVIKQGSWVIIAGLLCRLWRWFNGRIVLSRKCSWRIWYLLSLCSSGVQIVNTTSRNKPMLSVWSFCSFQKRALQIFNENISVLSSFCCYYSGVEILCTISRGIQLHMKFWLCIWRKVDLWNKFFRYSVKEYTSIRAGIWQKIKTPSLILQSLGRYSVQPTMDVHSWPTRVAE